MGGREKQIIILVKSINFDSVVVKYMCDKSSCFNSHHLTALDLRSCQALQKRSNKVFMPILFLLMGLFHSIFWDPF